MAIFDWVSVRLLLDFDAKLLYGFTVPMKGEGGGVKGTCLLRFHYLHLPFSHRQVSSFDLTG